MTITIKQNKSNTTNSSDSGLTEKTNPLYEFAFMGVQSSIGNFLTSVRIIVSMPQTSFMQFKRYA